MTAGTLFDLEPADAGTLPTSPAPTDPKASYGRRLTARNRNLLDRGTHPATRRPLLDREQGLTCASCAHLFGQSHNSKTYWKCDLTNATRGPATDVRRKWPACDRYAIAPPA